MSLKDFLSHFSNTSDNKFKKIDPLNMFACKFTKDEPSNLLSAEFCKDDKYKLNDILFTDNLKYYVQRVAIPNFSIINDSSVDTVVGSFQTHKLFLTPDNQTFTLEILNTEYPLLENVFLPWMREIQSPQWVYKNYPYTKATFEVNLSSHSDLKYVFLGCRPTNITSFNPSHDLPSSISRNVIMTFDFMYAVKTEIKKTENSNLQNPEQPGKVKENNNLDESRYVSSMLIIR